MLPWSRLQNFLVQEDDDPREIKESDIHGKQSIPCRIDPWAKIPFQDYIRGILKVK